MMKLIFLSTLSLRRATLYAILNRALMIFLSTLSLRRATRGIPKVFSSLGYFYPRSPCGERRKRYRLPDTPSLISIHALLAESDTLAARWVLLTLIFLSTLSLRRATRYGRPIDVQLVFLSTLSLRRATGSNQTIISEPDNFYPRSPCGERPIFLL